MRFIFDHNLPPNLARALDHLVDDEVTCLRDRGWQADMEIAKLAGTCAAGTCFKVPVKGAIQRFSPQGKRPI